MTTSSQQFNSILLMIVLVCGCFSSYNKVETMINNVKRVNPCNDLALGALLSDVEQGKPFSGHESNEDVRSMCPSLKYTCCNKPQLNLMVDELKNSFSYLNYRAKTIKKLFKRIKEIAEETFKVFLSEMTEPDIKCYNSLIDDRFKKFSDIYSENKTMIEKLNENHSTASFNSEKMILDFTHLRSLINVYLVELNQGNSDKEKYYSGFLCTMCSPMFSKHFKMGKERPLMELNKYFCKKIVETQIKGLKIIDIYKFLQRFLDILYCARKNSKQAKDYTMVDNEKLQMLPAPVEMYYNLINERIFCVNDVERFVTAPNAKDPNCKELCHGSLNLFEQNYIILNKIIMAENEIYNMFFRLPDNDTADERLEHKIDEYRSTRNKYVELGSITMPLPENNTVEIMSMLKQKPTSSFNFTEIEIEITNFMGVNTFHTPMDPSIYSSVLLKGLLQVLLLWACFF